MPTDDLTAAVERLKMDVCGVGRLHDRETTEDIRAVLATLADRNAIIRELLRFAEQVRGTQNDVYWASLVSPKREAAAIQAAALQAIAKTDVVIGRARKAVSDG